jgi:uncharacterized protein (DUF433 family)
MQYRPEITSESDDFTFGRIFVSVNGVEETNPVSTFCRYRHDLWCIGTPHEVLARLGITTTPKRAQEFVDLLDGDLDGFGYLVAATPAGSGDEALKWIMGGLAALLNERGLAFSDVHRVLPADYLRAFVDAYVGNRFERSFAKDVFAELVAAERFRTVFGTEEIVEDPEICGGRATYQGSRLEVADFSKRLRGGVPLEEILEDWGYALTLDRLQHGEAYLVAREEMGFEQFVRRTGEEIVARIIAQPRFKAADASEVDAIIAQVLAANPEMVARVPNEPKLVNWLVGQTMKAAKGKAPAPVVLAKLNAHFGF